jgi:beta-glucosidase-like glycosyl hydrolase
VTDPARVVIEALRLDRWSVDEVDQRARSALAVGVGGFVLFGGDAGAVQRLCGELRAAAGRPIWLAADLERGAGQQFAGCSELPPPAALAAHPDPLSAARFAAGLTGREARGLGLNWVLAPVLDLDVEPDNPIVATRSFGSDPEQVTALARAWIDACQAEGVAACAKHFPGHGRTRTDSHMELPVVDAPAALLAHDLAPFRGVADRVASVMPGHVAYPALGAAGPATRSPAIVTDLLRRQLGFGGLVATDAMIMSGFGSNLAIGAVEAIRAGCDVLLYPEDVEGAIRALKDAAERDPKLDARLRESIDRSDALLARLEVRDAGGGFWQGGTSGPPSEADAPLHLATSTILDRSSDALRRWDPRQDTELWIASDDPPAQEATLRNEFGAAFARELQVAGWRLVGAGKPGPERGSPASSAVRDSARSASTGAVPAQRIVLLEATPRGWKGRGGLSPEVVTSVREALETARLAFAIVFGHPRILEELGREGACAWAVEPIMERAAARWLDRVVSRGSDSVHPR